MLTLSKHDVHHATSIGLPRLKHWGERGIVARPYNVVKTLALSVGCYLADRGLPIEMIKRPVGLIASKSEDELLASFRAGKTRLTILTDTGESVIESPKDVAQRFADAKQEADTRIWSLPLRTYYDRVLVKLSNI